MVNIVGHGPFEEYKCELSIKNARLLSDIIDELSIPNNLKEVLIPVKDNSIINLNDSVKDNDEIHLFMQVSGG